MGYNIHKAPQQSRPAIAQICGSLGIGVFLDSKGGYLDAKTKGVTYIRDGRYRIVLNPNYSIEERRLTLCHELTHIILGHLLPSYVGDPEQREFEAESLGYIIYSYIYNHFYAAEHKFPQKEKGE